MIAVAKKLTSAGEEQAVDEDHHAGALQVLHLRAARFRGTPARATPRRSSRESNGRSPTKIAIAVKVGQIVPFSHPSASSEKCRFRGSGTGGSVPPRWSSVSPHQTNQDDDHHGRDLHDPQRIVARLVQALRVAPPEVDRDEDRDEPTAVDPVRQVHADAAAREQVVEQARRCSARPTRR